MVPAALGTETQSLSSLAESIGEEDASGGIGGKEGWVGGAVVGFFWNRWNLLVLYPCHGPALSWTASVSGHRRKLINRTFAG